MTSPAMDVTLSAVVPASRVDAALLQTMHCLRAQTHPALEIVLVLPESVDSLDVAAGERLVRCACTPTVCHDSGLQAATGDIVAVLSPGLLPGPEWAAATVAAFDEGTAATIGDVASASSGWIPGRSVVRDRASRRVVEVDAPLDSYVVPDADPYLVAPDANFSVRRSVLGELGGADESSSITAAEDLGRRLIDAGHRVVRVRGALVHDVRDGGDAAASGRLAGRQGRLPEGVRSPGAVRCVIRDDGDISSASTPETHDELHLLLSGASAHSVGARPGAGPTITWTHRVPTIGDAVTVLAPSEALVAVGREAGVLRELLRIGSGRRELVIDDQRPVAGWPFAALLAADERSRRALVGELVETALRCATPDALSVAAELLDGDAYPVALPALVRRTVELPDDVFLGEVFATLVHRAPTDAESSYFAVPVAREGGRTRTVRNVASSREGRQVVGKGEWTAVVDDEVEAARWTRLRAALDLPADQFLSELYSTVLRRPPDAEGLAHHRPHVARRAGRIELVRSVATSGEAGAIGVDAAEVLAGIGAPLHPGVSTLLRRRLAGVLRRVRPAAQPKD